MLQSFFEQSTSTRIAKPDRAVVFRFIRSSRTEGAARRCAATPRVSRARWVRAPLPRAHVRGNGMPESWRSVMSALRASRFQAALTVRAPSPAGTRASCARAAPRRSRSRRDGTPPRPWQRSERSSPARFKVGEHESPRGSPSRDLPHQCRPADAVLAAEDGVPLTIECPLDVRAISDSRPTNGMAQP